MNPLRGSPNVEAILAVSLAAQQRELVIERRIVRIQMQQIYSQFGRPCSAIRINAGSERRRSSRPTTYNLDFLGKSSPALIFIDFLWQTESSPTRQSTIGSRSPLRPTTSVSFARTWFRVLPDESAKRSASHVVNATFPIGIAAVVLSSVLPWDSSILEVS